MSDSGSDVEPPTASPPVAPPAAPPAASPAAKSRRHSRRVLVNGLCVVGIVVGVFAVMAVWVNRQLLDADNWAQTSSRLLADPVIATAVGGALVNQLFSEADVAARLEKTLPPRAAALAAPLAAGLHGLALQLAPRLLASPAVQKAWRLANRRADFELIRILNGGGNSVSTRNGVVTLQLHALLVQLADELGLQQQLAGVQSKLSGSSGASARNTVQQKLGVTLPPASGGIVILRAKHLKTAQSVVKAIKGLAVVLPIVAAALFILAVWLAVGWRRVALRKVGWSLIVLGVAVLLARRFAGNGLVVSLVAVPANREAAHQAVLIGTTLLRDIAVAIATYGVIFVIAAWTAGPTRPARALRRALAPTLREHPARAYGAAAVALLLVVLWGPFPSTRQVWPVIGIAILLAVGIRALQRITSREFPDAQGADTAGLASSPAGTSA